MNTFQKHTNESITGGVLLVLIGGLFLAVAAYKYFHHIDGAPVLAFIGVFVSGLGGALVQAGWR